MPNLFAHRLFVDQLVGGRIKDADLLDALRLGTQGPDPLFYYGLMPWRAWHYCSALKKYGNGIHRTDGREFFMLLLARYQLLKDPWEKRVFGAFVVGQLAHFLLDRGAHPFVYYFSGFDSNGKLTGRYHFEHADFESRLDCALRQAFASSCYPEEPVELIPDNPRVYRAIDQNLTPVVEKLFNAHLSKHYYSNSIKNFRSMQKLSSHRLIREVCGKKSMFNALYTPREYSGDSLNLARASWKNPVSGLESTDTFLEIFAATLGGGERLISEYLDCGLGDFILSYLDGNSYKGIPVDGKMIYRLRAEGECQ